MYAIIQTGGKQYKDEKGDVLRVEKLDAKADDKYTFEDVLFVGGKSVKVGNPTVEGASVEAKVLAEGKAKKVTVYKYKPKKGYAKKQGHRQPFTKVVIEKING